MAGSGALFRIESNIHSSVARDEKAAVGGAIQPCLNGRGGVHNNKGIRSRDSNAARDGCQRNRVIGPVHGAFRPGTVGRGNIHSSGGCYGVDE